MIFLHENSVHYYIPEEFMSAIHMMAIYRIKPDKVDEVRLAVTEFVQAVKENEAGTLFYEAYQGKEDLSFFLLILASFLSFFL